MTPITEFEKEVFDLTTHVAANNVLVRTQLDGKGVAVICGYLPESDGVFLQPLALVIGDDLMARLTPPDGALTADNHVHSEPV